MSIVIALSDLHSQLATLPQLREVQLVYPEAVTVFLGDYIDCYGPNHGLTLLTQIRAMQAHDPTHTIVLLGNHEQGLLDYLASPTQSAWLDYGGKETLRAATRDWTTDQGPQFARQLLLNHQPELIAWLRQLPLSYTLGQLSFVHAGLDLTLPHPLQDTSRHDQLWLDAKYWYAPAQWELFAHNPLTFSVVTGHTPTAHITGRYAGDVHPAKTESERNAIYAVQYPNEMPRYFIDGGAGSGQPNTKLGNIAVFDSETGMLIDAYED